MLKCAQLLDLHDFTIKGAIEFKLLASNIGGEGEKQHKIVLDFIDT